MNLTREIKDELDVLEIQFGRKAILSLNEYAELYGLKRNYAAQHLRRSGVPFTKEGRKLFVSFLDLAAFRANNKRYS